MTQTERVRVFVKRGIVHGCSFKRRLPVPLGARAGDPRVAGLRVAGDYVGFWIASGDFEHETDTQDVRTVNLRTRSTRKRGSCGSTFDHTCQGLVLKPNGSVAWTTLEGRGGFMGLWKSDTTGEWQAVDEGEVVQSKIENLALSGSTLYWTKGGTARSASLR